MKIKIDQKKKILSCTLAIVTAISASGIAANAFSTSYQAYPGHGGASITSQAATKAASGDYGWQNELNLLKSVGTIKPDGTGYGRLYVPENTNKSDARVNANGETASDRIANSWANGYTFYMNPPSESDDYEYEVTRGGKTYTFNKSNNWGWGKAATGSGAITSIPAKGDTTGSTTYSTTDLVYGAKTNQNLAALGLSGYSSSHTRLTYNDLFSWTSGLVMRDNNLTGSIQWFDGDSFPTTPLSSDISNALRFKYVTTGNYTTVNKPSQDAAGDSDWQNANKYLAWIYNTIGSEITTKGLSLENIVNNEKYYNESNYPMENGTSVQSLGEVALEALKSTKHSG